jgi:hypothetical protein
MLRILLWFVITLVAVISTVVASSRVQSSLSRSFPYTSRYNPLEVLAYGKLLERLAQEPLQAAVLRELSVRKNERFELLKLSQKVSRRDPLTQLLLIEHTTDQGDIPSTLEHYNVLLAISPGIRRGIIDLLGTAAGEPEIFSALAVYQKKDWFPAAINRMVAEANTGAAVLNLLEARPSAKEAVTAPDHISSLISMMLAKPDPQYAFALLEQHHDHASNIDQFGFSKNTVNGRFAPLTWQQAKDVVAVPDNGEEAVALRVTAAPNIRTGVAERFTDLAPDTYRLSGIAEVNNAPKLQLLWVVRCKGEAASNEIIKKATQPSLDGGQFELFVTLSERCPVQHWQLAVLGDDARLASIVTIRKIRLEPLN